MTLTVGSLFAGVGGFDLALERVGLKVIWNCEIDTKCRKVLAHHWPGVPRFKDVRTVTGGELRTAGLAPDVIVGGFPCTDVSVAGKRAGLAGEQSRLFFEFARLLDELRPAWTVIENVPGLLSSHRGADMGTVVGHLVDIGYGVAWRVLDAQYFGVAQRRRRVFVVGCLGDRARAAEVLLVGEGGGGDPPARRAAGEEPAGSAEIGTGGRCWPVTWRDRGLEMGEEGVANAIRSSGDGHVGDQMGYVLAEGGIVQGLTGSFGNGGADGNKAQAGWLIPDTVPSLTAGAGTNNMSPGFNRDELFIPAVSNALCSNRGQRNDHNEQTFIPMAYGLKEANRQANGWGIDEERACTLDGQGRGSVATPQLAVRRLTPLECLRLQGFPDDWLDGLGLADSVKYRMADNAVAVPVVEWLGWRLVTAHTDGDERA